MAALLVACGGGGSSGSDSSPPPSSTQPPPTTPPGGQPSTNEPPANQPQQPMPDPELEAPPVAATPDLPTPTPAMPAPPPSHQLPSGVDVSNPGVTLRPVAATASSALGGNTAARAIDGNATTRWESAHTDDAWIQFDFGVKTQIGSMKLTWENAYGREYSIRVSDDGDNWYQLRYVVGGRGGAEEFMNLNSNVRYVRLTGVKRATQYGYSLFEVEFKSPGRDNTLGGSVATSLVPFPSAGEPLAPAPAERPPIEGLQFTLADGTLVTRYAQVGRSRHGRERGEDWNEIGYGPNETVDAAGNPVDKGPGAYLNFVAQYFDGRSWGVEIIDNSRVAGVTRPTLRVNQYFQQAQRAGGHSFFRGFDRPGVTGFGWMSPGQLVNPSLYLNDAASCQVQPKPPEGRLANASGLNDGCSVTLDNYPGHAELSPDANGVLAPNGRSVASRSLRVGDVIEVTMSFFSTPEAMAAAGNKGTGHRYYTNELTYVVGSGLRPQYGVQPRLMNAPLPEETWQGGLGSVSYDYADNSEFMFQQPHNHIGMQNMQRFLDGRRIFHTNMRTGDHNESGNERHTALAGLQGQFYNQSTCFSCHINNGRSMAPQVVNQRLDTMVVRTAQADSNGRQLPHPMYGMAAQMNSQPSSSGVRTDWGTGVRVAGFNVRTVTLNDGTAVQLSKPTVAFDGPTPGVYSLRSAQPVIGMGLLEAIPDADIIARARVAPDADGVKGTANYVYDPETGAVRLGRYGWKASKVSLRHQVAAAALQDMSVTSPLYPNRDCMFGPANCNTNKVEPGISEDILQQLTRYVALLAVPAQRSLVSGFPKGVAPLAYLDVNPTQIAAGSLVFDAAKCSGCHTREMRAGTNSEFAEVRNQTIRPYTDLLLHDMGPDLADTLVEGQATGSMWRTSALWGVGYTEHVAGKGVKIGYLHDSRARTLTEAILWHGGEATTSRQRFEQLSTQDRAALLSFLRSL
ncbi:di-heme oxidoredictase family protein [Steroidobacter cummioxidans]|uniref:di-heme oxidoredictase family protein n=1 Tax=Steroidobacter cummioxidans TaxID=1803913 RepID=UPI000E31885E